MYADHAIPLSIAMWPVGSGGQAAQNKVLMPYNESAIFLTMTRGGVRIREK